MSGVDMDPEKVGKAGENLEDVGEKLKIMGEEYIDKISTYRGCWGTGEFGEAFAKKYYQGLTPLVEGVEALGEAAKNSGKTLGAHKKRMSTSQEGIIDHINGSKRG
ncbi:hypothetical protein [Streptomyces tsukubensis]|uniref:hypothetical protein n=1 Tax=Streptomyces tsukubensis TaxID=83656 RepID=UPI00344C909A